MKMYYYNPSEICSNCKSENNNKSHFVLEYGLQNLLRYNNFNSDKFIAHQFVTEKQFYLNSLDKNYLFVLYALKMRKYFLNIIQIN